MQSPPGGCDDLLCMCCNNNLVFALAALVQHISRRFDGFQGDRGREGGNDGRSSDGGEKVLIKSLKTMHETVT